MIHLKFITRKKLIACQRTYRMAKNDACDMLTQFEIKQAYALFICSTEVPVFSQELHDVTVNEHDTVTLEVIVSSNSAFELEWFKNAVDITESDRISLVKHEDGRFTLNIQDCDDDDTGEYCCVAQNEAGRVTCAGWLTVEGN